MKEILQQLKQHLDYKGAFYSAFCQDLFFCCVTTLYQTNENKKIIINHYTDELWNLIKSRLDLDEKNLKKEKMTEFKNLIATYLFRTITDESAQAYLFHEIAGRRILTMELSLNDLQTKLKIGLRNLDTTDEAFQDIRNHLNATFELMRQFTKDQCIKKQVAIKNDVFNNLKVMSLWFVIMLYTFNANVKTNFEPIYNDVLLSFYSTLFAAFMTASSQTALYYTSNLDFIVQENIFKKNFNIDDLIENFRDYKKNPKEPKQEQDGELYTPNKNKEEKNKVTNESKPVVWVEHGSIFTGSGNQLHKQKQWIDKNTSKQEETPTVATWKLINQQNIHLSIADTYPLSKNSPTVPLIEGKYEIFYDDENMIDEHKSLFRETAQAAVFQPGAAEGKNCIHWLGNNLYSIKRSQSDIRVIGTPIGKNAQGKIIIFFSEVVDHSELKRITNDQKRIEQVKAKILNHASKKYSQTVSLTRSGSPG